MEIIPQKRVVLGTDLNGQDAEREGILGIHGGHGLGNSNAKGERIIDLAETSPLT